MWSQSGLALMWPISSQEYLINKSCFKANAKLDGRKVQMGLMGFMQKACLISKHSVFVNQIDFQCIYSSCLGLKIISETWSEEECQMKKLAFSSEPQKKSWEYADKEI